jgi:hypothetical protein
MYGELCRAVNEPSSYEAVGISITEESSGSGREDEAEAGLV